jgi:uncharacterized membrane protein
MSKATITLIFLLILVVPCLFSQLGLTQEELDESTTYQISINSDASAHWIIERRFILNNQEEVTIFQNYISEFDTKKDIYLEDFANETQILVERGNLISGRSMKAEYFDVTVGLLETATAIYGVIKFEYDWTGFAKIEEERLVVGDVFEGGFYLYKDDTLIVNYPNKFGLQAVSPLPDDERPNEQSLLWYGRRNFGGGEPTIILTTEKLENDPLLQNNIFLIIGVAAIIILVIFVAYWLYKHQKNKRQRFSKSVENKKFEIKSDEDKVVELLEKTGGQIYQSMITKQLAFSKAKTSLLLTEMEKKGLVKRKKMGREVIVTLL